MAIAQLGYGTTYQQLLSGVEQYYGYGSDQWLQIAKYGVNSETLPIIENVPGVTITKSVSGKYLGYDYSNPFASVDDAADIINSNVQTGMYGAGSFTAQVPATAVQNTETGLTMMESGAKVASTGAKLATLADRANLAVIGVSVGTKLGKLIDQTIYNVNPEWWDEHYPTINPETWDDMASSENGKDVIRTIFGLEDDTASMYVDERMLPYTYMMMLDNGAYDVPGAIIPSNETTEIFPGWTLENATSALSNPSVYERNVLDVTIRASNNVSPVYFGFIYVLENKKSFVCMAASENSFNIYQDPAPGSDSSRYEQKARQCENGGKTYYVVEYNGWNANIYSPSMMPGFTKIDGNVSSNAEFWGYAVLYGTIGGLTGVENNPEPVINIVPDNIINPTTGKPVTPRDSPDDVLQAMKNTYPALFDGAIYEDVPQPDGSVNRITYVPVPYPNTDNPTQPTTDDTPGVNPQTNIQVNPDTRTPELIQQLIDSLTTPPGNDTPTPPTPPDTGSGNTPPTVIPAGTANALYSIYNPTQAELNSFGGWLWSSNFVDQLLKLFNDPMQAIIGLHKVFATPSVSGKSNIKVGYLDSGVPSNVVSSQYATIDCGAISIREYFGNVFDYDPFTQVYIYLPFIGIEKLDTGDVMRGQIQVVYHVDVLTGACLAEIKIMRDNAGGTIYTYTGNCAVQYPISSGSYMGIVASLASVAGGVVGTIASGGALAPVAVGAVNGALNAHTRVQHSGGFSGNAGAMGIKKPYVIITRPQSCLADTFPALDGYPANKSTTISACSGFVQCKSCHVENVPATDAELTEIENLLKSGIII